MRVEEGVGLARFTTLGTGGPARAFARPEWEAEVEELLHWAQQRSLAVAVVGLGSNLLAADDGVDALVLKLGGELAGVETDGDVLRVGGTALRVLHTPGHSPGSCCLYAPDLGVVFSGDTLFQGGPGATGRSYSDFDEIVASIRSRLLTLPAATEVRTGHGDSTTIADEAEHIG